MSTTKDFTVSAARSLTCSMIVEFSSSDVSVFGAESPPNLDELFRYGWKVGSDSNTDQALRPGTLLQHIDQLEADYWWIEFRFHYSD